MINQNELETRFMLHAPKPGQHEKCEDIRRAGLAVATKIARCGDARDELMALVETVWRHCPLSRELGIVQFKIRGMYAGHREETARRNIILVEEIIFWADAAIARRE